MLQEGHLGVALEWLARWTETRYGFSVDLTLPPEIPETARTWKILLFESVRQLLFNAIKHANVQRAAVDDGPLRIVVDRMLKHVGEAVVSVCSAYGKRLNLIGGTLDIESSPVEGARFVLRIELRQPKNLRLLRACPGVARG